MISCAASSGLRSVKARAGLAFGSTSGLCRRRSSLGRSQFSMGRKRRRVRPRKLRIVLGSKPLPRALSIWLARIGLRGQVEYAQFQTQRITSYVERPRHRQETSVSTGTLGLSTSLAAARLLAGASHLSCKRAWFAGALLLFRTS